jgi:hypothetical protein
LASAVTEGGAASEASAIAAAFHDSSSAMEGDGTLPIEMMIAAIETPRRVGKRQLTIVPSHL